MARPLPHALFLYPNSERSPERRLNDAAGPHALQGAPLGALHGVPLTAAEEASIEIRARRLAAALVVALNRTREELRAKGVRL